MNRATNRLVWAVAGTLMVFGRAIEPGLHGQNLVVNGSFESPVVSGDTYTTTFGSLATTGVTGWTFGSSSGSSYDGLAATSGAFGGKVIEFGSNAAFDQGTGWFSQPMTLSAGTSYVLSFDAMGRAGANGANPINVTLGGWFSHTVTPTNGGQSAMSDWIPYAFNVTAPASGTYALKFAGTLPYVGGSSDHTTYIDNIAVMPFWTNAPMILAEPIGQQTLFTGQTAEFSVQATSVPTPSYQWQAGTNGIYVNLMDDGQISGSSSATLIISNLAAGDPTNFVVRIFNSVAATNSTPATLTVLAAPVPGAPRTCVTVINPSFEDNRLSGDAYTSPFGTLDPQAGIPGWQFNSSGGDAYAGIVTEAGALMGAPKYIPQCWQAAFIQGTGQFSQAVTFKNGGTYLIRCRAAGRSNGGVGPETIAVSADGRIVETFTPAVGQWALFTSAPFAVTAGVHQMAFAGTVPYSQSDRTSFIDAVQIATPAEVLAVAPPSSPVYDVVFVGDSITAGATISDPVSQASSPQCVDSLGQRYNAAVRMSNQGHSGHTTVDWLPSSNASSDFQLAVAAAASLRAAQPGQLVFSIMLGANDSAQSGPNGSPVSATNYRQNLQSIIDQFLADYTNALVFVHYPTWYSTNTQNSSLYGAIGLARLESYLPQIDLLVSNCAVLYPGRVFAGDKLAFAYFSTNYLTTMTAETGPQGTFYLHPNAAGAAVLGRFWAEAIAASLKFATNGSFVAWLQSQDKMPGSPGTAFEETPTNSTASNGVAYGNPNGISVKYSPGQVDLNVTADIRGDARLANVLQSSADLVHWNALAWSVDNDQGGTATGFIRYTLREAIDWQEDKFYRLELLY